MKIKLVMFDLDDTLAKSKCDLAPDMADAIERLLGTRHVSVISGCRWEQFLGQFVRFIDPKFYGRLIVAPVSGGQIYRWRSDGWQLVNSTSIGVSYDQVVRAFDEAFAVCGFEQPTQLWGPQFEDRVCQVTFSALGQQAPHEIKKTWDPNFEKRKPLIAELKKRLPDYLSIRAGGSTSIDVSGFEKDYGIRQVTLQLKDGINEEDVLFIGDAIFPGGNDYAVTKTNVRYHPTRSLEHTKELIELILNDEDAILAASRRGVTG